MIEKDLDSLLKLFVPYYKKYYIVLFTMSFLIGSSIYIENKLIYYFVNIFNNFQKFCSDLFFFNTSICDTGTTTVAVLILSLFFIVYILKIFLEYYSEYIIAKLSAQTFTDIEKTVLENVIMKDENFFKNFPVNTITATLSKDISRLKFIRLEIFRAMQDVLFIIVNLVFFATYDFLLTSFLIVAFGISFFITKNILEPIKKIDKNCLKYNDKLKSYYEDFLNASAEIQVNNYQVPVFRKLTKLQKIRDVFYIKSLIQLERAFLSNKITFLVTFIFLLSVIMYLIYKNNAMNSDYLGLIPVVTMVIPAIFVKISNLVNIVTLYKYSQTSVERIKRFSSDEISCIEKSDKIAKNNDLVIQLIDLNYYYDNCHHGFSNVNLNFYRGNCVSIIGSSGSGKSTLINLLINRLKPSRGKRLIFGEEYDNVDIGSYIGYMPQSIALFNTTIKKNIFIEKLNSGIQDEEMHIFDQLGFTDVCLKLALGMYPKKRNTTNLQIDEKILKIRNDLLPDIYHSESIYFDEKSVVEFLSHSSLSVRSSFSEMANEEIYLLINCFKEVHTLLFEIGLKNLELNKDYIKVSNNFRKYKLLTGEKIKNKDFLFKKELVDKMSEEAFQKKYYNEICITGLMTPKNSISDLGKNLDVLKNNKEFVVKLKNIIKDYFVEYSHRHINDAMSWFENIKLSHFSKDSSQLDDILFVIKNDKILKKYFLSLGLEFEVGNKGNKLSGGQKQLTVLIRTILRKTPILILDEPTSSLDIKLKKKTVDFLSEWKKEKLIIAISHDEKLIESSDHVIELSNFHILNGMS